MNKNNEMKKIIFLLSQGPISWCNIAGVGIGGVEVGVVITAYQLDK